MAFLTLILAMLVFGALGISMVSRVAEDMSGATDDLASAQAFYVAEGGMQYVLMHDLSGDSDFSDNVSPTGTPFGGTPLSLSPGQFWIEYANQTAEAVDVKVTSRVGESIRVVRQSVGQGGSGFDYVTMANGNININSSTGHIYGDVVLRGVANVDEDVLVHGNIVDDPDLVVPTMDLGVYEAMCTSTYSGNLTISTNTTSNLCVNGNVTLTGGITYSGLLYATGNVSIDGHNVIVNGTIVTEGTLNGAHKNNLQFNAVPNGDQNMPAIVSQGNINLDDADDLRLNGVIWNAGNANFGGADDMVFNGSIMAGGNFNMNSADNLSITFNAELTAGIPGLSGSGAEASLSLSNWRAY